MWALRVLEASAPAGSRTADTARKAANLMP
jgi:hypothetical protein